MALIIFCPSCQAQLHLPEEYLGRKVRCASCNSMFEGPPAALVNRPSSVPPAIDLPLELSLDEPAAPPPPRQSASSSPGLVGATELKLSKDDEPAGPGEADPIPMGIPVDQPARPQRRDDMIPCPSCSTYVHRDSGRCYRCGKRLVETAKYVEEDDEPPSRRSRGLRRDRLPHRGGAILALGITGLVCLLFCGIIGIGLSITAWSLGAADLRRYARRELDPEGYGATNAGYICGIIGTVLHALWLLACAGFFTFIILEESRPRYNQPAPRFGPFGPRR
jgi:predicted Zn finger-like uncharacterized protein